MSPRPLLSCFFSTRFSQALWLFLALAVRLILETEYKVRMKYLESLSHSQSLDLNLLLLFFRIYHEPYLDPFQSNCGLFSSTLESLVFFLSSSSCPCSWSLATFTYPHSGSCTLCPSSSLQPSLFIPGRLPCSQLRLCCVGLTKPKLHCSQGDNDDKEAI